MKAASGIKLLFWGLFLFLSYWFFLSDVWSKFRNDRKGFSFSQVPIQSQYFPRFATSFCPEPSLKSKVLTKNNITKTLQFLSFDLNNYGGLFNEASFRLTEDFDIIFEMPHEESVKFKVGNNKVSYDGIEVNVIVKEVPTINFGLCYTIWLDESTPVLKKTYWPFLIERLNPDLVQMKVYITSPENYLGLVTSEWKNLKVIKETLDFGSGYKFLRFDLLEIEEYLLCNKKSTIYKTYFECDSKNIQKIVPKSGKQCIIDRFLLLYENSTLEMCQNAEEELKMYQEYYNSSHGAMKECSNVCKLRYFSAEADKADWSINTNKPIYVYISSTSFTKTIKEEYYIIDFVNLFGNVGGTLGIFLGVSLHGIISNLIDTLFHSQ